MHRILTLVFLILVSAVVIVYDIYAEVYLGDENTISKLLLWLNQHAPVLSFVFCFWVGVLVGHLFLYQTVSKPQLLSDERREES